MPLFEIMFLKSVTFDPSRGRGERKNKAKKEQQQQQQTKPQVLQPRSNTKKTPAEADCKTLWVLKLINLTILKSKHHLVLPTIRFLLLSNKVSTLFISNNIHARFPKD